MKILLYVLTLTALISCSPESQNRVQKKSNPTVEELIQKNGEPDSKEINSFDGKSTMYLYGKTTYQVKEGLVEMKFRFPEEHEKTSQYWRHKFQNESYDIKPVNITEHTKEYRLTNKKRGIIVLFSEAGSVIRIAEDMGVSNE